MAGRLPVRFLGLQLQRQSRRHFSCSSCAFDAHNFYMPAMSPTMTEGGISSWKVKPGDSFQPGDVLVEIETDKATMDVSIELLPPNVTPMLTDSGTQVEAQEAGIMVKIFSDDGAKGVQVGTRIAVIGDEGDSADALEIPADDSQTAKSPSENVAKAETSAPSYSSGTENVSKGTPENPRPSRDRPKSSPTTAGTGPGQNTKYPMYPSVIALIHENHISDTDVAKIPATGPQNRLLKGDVLAYLGSIDADYSKQQSERIEHAGHMDLSSIKIIPAENKAKKPTTNEHPGLPVPQETSVQLPISLSEVLKLQKRIQDTLQINLPLSTFLARAVDFANEDLPESKKSASADELFDAVLGLDQIPKGMVRVSRGQYLPSVMPAPAGAPLRAQPIRKLKQEDIIDVLTGRAGPLNTNKTASAVSKMIAAGGPAGAVNVFTLTVPAGEEKRARIFLERMKTVLQVEPGKLVL